jgi:hypothetical protein
MFRCDTLDNEFFSSYHFYQAQIKYIMQEINAGQLKRIIKFP